MISSSSLSVDDERIKIPKKYIEALPAKASIVDVIGDEITLKKSGVNYFAACPFHSLQKVWT